MHRGLAACLALGVVAATAMVGEASDRVRAAMADRLELLPPSAVKVEGFLGRRFLANERERLLKVDEEPILVGFEKKPGSHPWIGEHAGKWMHAATLTWAYTGDRELRRKLDRVAKRLIAAQEPDGYLGTYEPGKRLGLFPGADWDVWSHKYNLLGLLTYHQYTGSKPALQACRKMGDLLIATFGPEGKSILSAGTHVGMAATSVLEPMVLLYRLTGDEKYLDFARYIVDAYDEPRGPQIVRSLLSGKGVNQTANGKAYEMMSNLVGLCELARATGEERYLEAARNAWEDIAARRLYVSGTTSSHEHFQPDHHLPHSQGDNVGETCATVTWMQLNFQLLRLTGDARYAGELERTLYNHLAAAQRPDGAQWCYFTPLEGTKPYGPGINCCVSSGPRGMALGPQLAYLRYREKGSDGLAVALFEPSQAALTLGGRRVTVRQESRFPREGGGALTFRMEAPATFGLRVRRPEWARDLRLTVNGERQEPRELSGWFSLDPRRWSDGDRVELHYTLGPETLRGTHDNAGRVAFRWGPFVLALDRSLNPELARSAFVAAAPASAATPFRPVEGEDLRFDTQVRLAKGERRGAVLVPFAEAGATGGRYHVWLFGPGSQPSGSDSLLGFAAESRSREGNASGSITDGDLRSFVVTFNGEPAEEDWFAAEPEEPVTFLRVVYAHGWSFHDGGWFDASRGKPRVQARREPGGPWEDLGELADYPATTATDSAGLKPGDRFTLRLPQPVRAVAVRVIGKPACGDNPAQAFSSCGELQAFAD